MKSAVIQLFVPSKHFKMCRVEYGLATSGKGYLYEIKSVRETIRQDVSWPVPQILSLNAQGAIDHQIAEKTQGEYSKEVLGVDMSKNKPANKPVIKLKHQKPNDEQDLPL